MKTTSTIATNRAANGPANRVTMLSLMLLVALAGGCNDTGSVDVDHRELLGTWTNQTSPGRLMLYMDNTFVALRPNESERPGNWLKLPGGRLRLYLAPEGAREYHDALLVEPDQMVIADDGALAGEWIKSKGRPKILRWM